MDEDEPWLREGVVIVSVVDFRIASAWKRLYHILSEIRFVG